MRLGRPGLIPFAQTSRSTFSTCLSDNLKLSLLSCPIALYPATTEREKISFHQLNKETGNRIKYRKVTLRLAMKLMPPKSSRDMNSANANISSLMPKNSVLSSWTANAEFVACMGMKMAQARLETYVCATSRKRAPSQEGKLVYLHTSWREWPMDEETNVTIALTAHFVTQAMVMLARNLTLHGALPEGAFEHTLRETLEHPGANRERLDYRMLEVLLKSLEHPNSSPDPQLSVIQGGKS
jgi:hypothetical protein